jgi:hypothetical protein
MSNMLSVPTGQIGDPVALFVLMVTDDGLLHRAQALAVRPRGSSTGDRSVSRSWDTWTDSLP